MLADVSSSEIPAQLGVDERLRTIGALGAVLDRATDELRRDVNVALRLIDAVIGYLPALPTAPGTVVLHGRALRLQANGLWMTGAVPAARATLGEALNILSQAPAGAIESGHVHLFEAYILSEAGDRDNALRLVRKAADEYAAQGDAKGMLQARLMEGVIRFDCQAFAEARAVFEEALPLAEAVRDERGRAMALGSLGHCARCLGHGDVALAYYAQALPIFDALGMSIDRQKILWALAKLSAQEGRTDSAVQQFAAIREDFLRRGMLLSAASIALDLVEVLITINRTDIMIGWCKDLVRTFSAAGMPPYALRALAYLRVAAEEGKLDVQVLGRVRADVREHLHIYT